MSEDVRVDWLRPIEAVHTDGRVSRDVKFEGYDCSHVGQVTCSLPMHFRTLFKMDGTPVYPECGWTIRNVDQDDLTDPTVRAFHGLHRHSEPRTAPSGGEVGAEVVMSAHMAETWRSLAKVNPADVGPHFARNWIEEARRIVAELDDPDITTARVMIEAMDGNPSDLEIATAAIKRGRALEKGAGR